jgi:hypothetical protein
MASLEGVEEGSSALSSSCDCREPCGDRSPSETRTCQAWSTQSNGMVTILVIIILVTIILVIIIIISIKIIIRAPFT